jgi:hypothetical protein
MLLRTLEKGCRENVATRVTSRRGDVPVFLGGGNTD